MTTHEADHDPELVARRASSFGGQAAAYAEHRPDYPPTPPSSAPTSPTASPVPSSR